MYRLESAKGVVIRRGYGDVLAEVQTRSGAPKDRGATDVRGVLATRHVHQEQLSGFQLAEDAFGVDLLDDVCAMPLHREEP